MDEVYVYAGFVVVFGLGLIIGYVWRGMKGWDDDIRGPRKVG